MGVIEVRGMALHYELSGDRPPGDGADGDRSAGHALPVVWGHGLTSSIAKEDQLGLLDWPAVRRHAQAHFIEAGEIELLVTGLKSMPAPDPFAGNPAWVQSTEDTVRNTDPVRLSRIFRGAAVADLPSPAEVAMISVPVRILAWTGDIGHPVSTAVRLCELIPHAELVTASTEAELLRWTSRAIEFVDSFR